jgi:hypothetical protein
MLYKKLFMGALLLAGSQLLQAAEPDPVLVPTPRAKALAATATNRPFLAATRLQQPVDLAGRGYAESESLVQGNSGGQAWVTRMLVRRPLDAGKFSGRVIVELLDASAGQESAPLWGFSWEHFLRRGDAWVGVTISPAAVDSLKKFNAARYAALSLPAFDTGSCGPARQGGPAGGDFMVQVAALLRSSSKENPLLGLNPQRLIVAGYSASGDYLTRLAIAFHRDLRLGDGAPVFDGYLSVSGGAATSPACVAAGLPRDVPFVAVSAGINRDAIDVQSENLRVFEVAGTQGAMPPAAGMPAAAELAGTGTRTTQPGDGTCREPLRDQALALALNAVWQQFDDLVVLKEPMASVPRIDPDTMSGGWRMPQVDLPLTGAAATPMCNAATGSMARFDATKLRQLYRDRSEYLRRFNAAVDQAVASRQLVKEDAAALKVSTLRTTPTF